MPILGGFEAQYLMRLRQEMQAFAVNSMEVPQGTGSFDYGRAIGFYNGMAWAGKLLESMLVEANEEEEQFNHVGTRQ